MILMGIREYKRSQNLVTWLNATFHLADQILSSGPISNIFANHNHSNLSDGMFSPESWLNRTINFIKILNHLSKTKFDSKWSETFNLSISDHNTFNGSIEFLKEKEKMLLQEQNIKYLKKIGSSISAEITSAKGRHWLLEVFPKGNLSINSTIPEYLGYHREDWKRTEKYFDIIAKNLVNEKVVKGISLARKYFEDQNFEVLSIVPHPMISIQSLTKQKIAKLTDINLIDGIEWISWKSKLKMEKLRKHYFNRIPLFSNSDSHDCILYALNMINFKTTNWVSATQKYFDLIRNNHSTANNYLQYVHLPFTQYSNKKTFNEVLSLLYYVLNLQGWREIGYLPKHEWIKGLRQHFTYNY